MSKGEREGRERPLREKNGDKELKEVGEAKEEEERRGREQI